MKRRIVDDAGGSRETPLPEVSAAGARIPSGMEKHTLRSGLFRYRYHLSSYPPNVQEHDRLSRFLGTLISRLMVATGKRMQPFICIDGRHLDDDFFARLRESGTTWRALLGFPLIPGFHPFRYLPIAYHINSREAWDDVAEQFLGTGGTAIYLTSLAADEFLTRLIQLLLIRDNRAATSLFPVYLPEVVLGQLEKGVGPSVQAMMDSFQFFVGENPSERAIDIVSAHEIQEVVNAVWESSSPRATG